MTKLESPAAATLEPRLAAARGVGPPSRPLVRRLVTVTLAVVPPLLLVGYWFTTSRARRISIIEDDAFYYLGVARSLADGQGSSFTGLVETNGYHPLWQLLLVPLAALTAEADRLVLAVLLVQGVMWAASVREVFKIGDAIGSWECAAGAMGAYAVLPLLTGHLAFNGMESGLVLLLLVVLVRKAVETWADGHDARIWGLPRDLGLGVLASLVFLARLDAVFAVVPLGGYLLLAGPSAGRRSLARRGLMLFGPVTVALAAYTSLNLALFGTPTPVSGQAKALGDASPNVGQLTQFFKLGKVTGRPLWIGTVALVLVGLALVSRRWRASRQLSQVMGMGLSLVVGQAILLAYLVTQTNFTWTFLWYHYQLAVFSFVAALALSWWALQRYGDVALKLCIGVACLVVVGDIAAVVVEAREEKNEAVFAAADFVRDELPDDAVLAMGDRAGYFGYLAGRPLLHLEGLVADADYLDALEHGDAAGRMEAEGVDYFVSGRRGSPVEIEGRSCRRFTEPPLTRGSSFEVTVCDEDLVFEARHRSSQVTVWRFRPELQEPPPRARS